MKKFLVVCLVGLACLALGFWLGQGRPIVRTEVRYEKGETLSGHYGAPDLLPERTELPGLAAVPPVPLVVWAEGRADTLWREPDTAAIVQDYKLLRHYSRLLFDNENGVLRVKAGTQYNRLSYLDYEFTPVLKTTTSVVEKAWQPFASIGYSTNGSLSVGGGVYYKHVGLEYGYNLPMNGMKGWHSLEVKWKW